MIKFLLIVLFIVRCSSLLAGHVVGGEIVMKDLGNDSFEISLIQYWDKNGLVIPTPTSGGNRDPDAELYIYSKRTNQFINAVKVTLQSTKDIEYQNKVCATSRAMNTVVGIYKGQISLMPEKYNDPMGYYIVWERCCRNKDINNITDPGESGMAFYLEFPPLTISNSSPSFQIPNGQYICNKRNFSMNMSAVDVDGDELRYSLVTPLNGYTNTKNVFGNSTPKTSYPAVGWSPGISLSNVIPGSKPLSINQNGIITVTSDYVGLYVFAIQCEEFRNGKKIGLIRRDFQLLVIDCNDDQPELPIVTFNTKPVTEIQFCPEKPVQLETAVTQDCYYQWQINGLNIIGATDSKIMVKDTGNYTVVKSFSKKCSRDTTSSVINVTYSSPPPAILSADKVLLCENQSAQLSANEGASEIGLLYSWNLYNKQLPGTSNSLKTDQPGLYQLTVTDSISGCTAKDTMSLSLDEIAVFLPAKVSVIEGNGMTLSPKIIPSNLVYTYSWMPDSELSSGDLKGNIEIFPLQSVDYTITVISSNGCLADATIQINVIKKMHIPTAFSPNNDGVNDSFEIFNSKGQIESLKVYNRWGEVIFSSDGYDVPWNGTCGSKLVDAGSYPYTIFANGEKYYGEVLVLR